MSAATARQATYISGWCGTAQHPRCIGQYAGTWCSCACHVEASLPPLSLVPPAAPLDLAAAGVFVEDDADDEPTIWLHDPARPDSPQALLARFEVLRLWPGTPERIRAQAEQAVDALWAHIVRGLPTSPPAVQS